MSLIDIAIPGVIGLLLVVQPRAFFRVSGDPTIDAARVRRYRGIGWLLLGVAGLYLVAMLLYMAGRAA